MLVELRTMSETMKRNSLLLIKVVTRTNPQATHLMTKNNFGAKILFHKLKYLLSNEQVLYQTYQPTKRRLISSNFSSRNVCIA